MGVRRAVLCPGSRNVPLVQAFATCGGFECFSVTDERSAGFFAIGLALHVQAPVVVCCTSGSALLNLYPAVCEAFYRRVPLVVVSADRPAAWIGQMDGQTLPQPGVFGGLVRKAVNLPEVRTEEDEWYANRLVNEALLEVDHHVTGRCISMCPFPNRCFILRRKLCLPSGVWYGGTCPMRDGLWLSS